MAMAAILALVPSLSAGLLFDKSEYASRRGKLMEKIPDGIAIILGAQPLTGYYNYYQNNDFMYLCGVEVPNAVLIIDGIRKESLLLFTATEPLAIYAQENLGVRVEDTILITETGCENLTAGIPREVKDIEELMKKRCPIFCY